MDVYTAQNAVDKLKKFVTELPDEYPGNMYSTREARYLKLGEDMYAVLQELASVPWLSAKLSHLVNRQNQISDDRPTTLPVSKESKKHSKAEVIACYANVLNQMSTKPSGYIEVDKFKSLLARWFHARFVLTADADFKCNTKYIGKWILLLSVGYGNSLESGSGDAWLSSVEQFVESLEGGFASSKYILPLDIYKSIKDISGKDTSLTGAVIWDILYDLGLSVLSPEWSVSYLPQDAAKALYDMRPDDVPYYYHNYKQSVRVLERSKLTPTKEATAFVD